MEAVSAWETAANSLLDVALRVAPLTEQQLISALQPNAPEPVPLELSSTAVTRAADLVFEQLRGPLAEGDDEAFRGMFAFLTGNMSVADAIMTAADSPDAIVASLMLDRIESIPAEAWQRDIAEAVRTLRGVEPVRGAQDDDLAELNDTLDKLTDQAGDELVAIGSDTVLAIALPHVGTALTAVLTGPAAKAFDAIRTGIHVGWAAVKKAASTVMNWVIDHVTHLVPQSMQKVIEDAVRNIVSNLMSNAGHAVGRIAANILGLGGTREAWRRASAGERDAATMQLTAATADEVSLLRNVTRVRTFIDKYGRWLISMWVKIPQVVLAVAALATAAMVLVLSALWHGLRDIKGLVSA